MYAGNVSYVSKQEVSDSALANTRNKIWQDKMRPALESEGTFAIVVGADHLEGPDGVIGFLLSEGYEVGLVVPAGERYQPEMRIIFLEN